MTDRPATGFDAVIFRFSALTISGLAGVCRLMEDAVAGKYGLPCFFFLLFNLKKSKREQGKYQRLPSMRSEIDRQSKPFPQPLTLFD